MKKISKKGIILSLYLIMYGAVRCIIETFRGDSLYLWGAKVSQMLSLLLMVIGIVLLVVIYTKKSKQQVNDKNNISKES